MNKITRPVNMEEPQKEEGKMKVRGCGDGVFVEGYRI